MKKYAIKGLHDPDTLVKIVASSALEYCFPSKKEVNLLKKNFKFTRTYYSAKFSELFGSF